MDVFVRVSYLQKALEEGVGTISLIWGDTSVHASFHGALHRVGVGGGYP